MKLKELNNLSNTELDISIAKLMGIKVESDGISHNLMACDLNTNTYNPNGNFLTFLPKYSSDLNAVNIVENSLTEEQKDIYSIYLTGVTQARSPEPARRNWNATARQRAEALVSSADFW